MFQYLIVVALERSDELSFKFSKKIEERGAFGGAFETHAAWAVNGLLIAPAGQKREQHDRFIGVEMDFCIVLGWGRIVGHGFN